MKRAWNDQRVEEIISYLLRAGVLMSALLVLAGGVIFLVRHGAEVPDYKTFRGEPEELRTIRGLFSIDTIAHGRGLIQLGLVLLILTPIARVAFSLLAFILERDWIYVAVSAIVLGLLLYSFTSA
jgi:uncharacterized membrane protein